MKKLIPLLLSLLCSCTLAYAVVSPARSISVDASTFTNNLGHLDTDVQTALKDLDTAHNAQTANALKTTPTQCNAGYFARGVDVYGNAQNCGQGSGGGGAWGSITGTLSNQTDLNSALNGKQETLVSGTNIKTINSTSILGSGDITISGGSTPASPSTAVQYNDSGSFGGSADFVYVPSRLTLNNATGANGSQTYLDLNVVDPVRHFNAYNGLYGAPDGLYLYGDGGVYLNSGAGHLYIDTTGMTGGGVTLIDASGLGLHLDGSGKAIFNGSYLSANEVDVGTTGSLGSSGTAKTVFNSDGSAQFSSSVGIGNVPDTSTPFPLEITPPSIPSQLYFSDYPGALTFTTTYPNIVPGSISFYDGSWNYGYDDGAGNLWDTGYGTYIAYIDYTTGNVTDNGSGTGAYFNQMNYNYNANLPGKEAGKFHGRLKIMSDEGTYSSGQPQDGALSVADSSGNLLFNVGRFDTPYSEDWGVFMLYGNAGNIGAPFGQFVFNDLGIGGGDERTWAISAEPTSIAGYTWALRITNGGYDNNLIMYSSVATRGKISMLQTQGLDPTPTRDLEVFGSVGAQSVVLTQDYTAISSPWEGQVAWDYTLHKQVVYNGTSWEHVTSL